MNLKIGGFTMTYTINGIQYWKRNGSYFSWTESEGRKVISEDMYLEALGKDVPSSETSKVSTWRDLKKGDVVSTKFYGKTLKLTVAEVHDDCVTAWAAREFIFLDIDDDNFNQFTVESRS